MSTQDTFPSDASILDKVLIRWDGKSPHGYDCSVLSNGSPVCLRFHIGSPEEFAIEAPSPSPAAHLLRGDRSAAWDRIELKGYTSGVALTNHPRLRTSRSGRIVIGWIDASNPGSDNSGVSLKIRRLDEGSEDEERASDSDAQWVSSFDLLMGPDNSITAVWTDGRDTHFDSWSHPGRDHFEKVFAREVHGTEDSHVERVDPKKRKYIAYDVEASGCRDGRVYAVWDELRRGDWFLRVGSRIDGAWLFPITIAKHDSTYMFYDIQCLDDGSAIVVWSSPGETQELFATRVLNGRREESTVLSRGACCAKIEASGNKVYLVYQSPYPWGQNPTQLPKGQVFFRVGRGLTWSAESQVASDAYLGSAQIAADGQGKAHIFWQERNGQEIILRHAVAAEAR